MANERRAYEAQNKKADDVAAGPAEAAGMPAAPSPAPAPGSPDGGGGAGGDMGGDHNQALQELAMALLELGVTPEQLSQMAQGGGGAAAPGGAVPGGEPAGPPPDVAKAAADIASAVGDYRLSGKFQVTEAKAGSQERKLRDECKQYVREVVNAGRRR
jgi:hypothetical protein